MASLKSTGCKKKPLRPKKSWILEQYNKFDVSIDDMDTIQEKGGMLSSDIGTTAKDDGDKNTPMVSLLKKSCPDSNTPVSDEAIKNNHSKKKGTIVAVAIVAVVIVVLYGAFGVGMYFGYNWYKLKVNSCGRPDIPQNTMFDINKDCTKSDKYSSVCEFRCKTGFQRQETSSIMECREYGLWHPKQVTSCKDTSHLIIECPCSFIIYVGDDQMFAYVNYGLPVATDSIDGKLKVVLEQGPHPGSKLPIIRYSNDSLVNEHTVVYSTVDSGGLTASCSFTVSVQDTSSPIIKCPSNFTTHVGDDQTFAYVNYGLPVATDSIDGKLEVVLEQGPPRGSKLPIIRYSNDSLVNEHTVLYSTVDSEGLTTSCSFTVIVQDRQCDPIRLSPNMHMNCTGPQFVYGSICSFSCSYGYEVKGAASITCELNEQNEVKWSSSVPMCKAHDCSDLKPILNGAMACTALIVGKFCSLACNNKYDIPTTILHGGVFFCDRSIGWVNEFNVPDCTEEKRHDRPRMEAAYNYYSGDCSSPAVKKNIKHKMDKAIQNSIFQGICQTNKCNFENVTIQCGINLPPDEDAPFWSTQFPEGQSTSVTEITKIQLNWKQWLSIVGIVACFVPLIVCVAIVVWGTCRRNRYYIK